MYNIVLAFSLITQGAKNLPEDLGQRVEIRKRSDVSIMPYSPDVKPSFYYLLKNASMFNETELRSFLHTEGIKKQVKSKIAPIKDRKDALKREDVSYAEILANLRTMAEWKDMQNKIRRGEVKNVQMAKLQMEERIRKMRLELVRINGTPEEYQKELEAYRKFEAFKECFLQNKEVEK